MHEPTRANRRTVLQTMATAVVGAGVASGGAVAGPGEADGRRSELHVATAHDHDANEHRFELDTHAVPSGWTTVEFENRTDHTHFAYLVKLPREALADAERLGLTPLELYVDTVTRPFQYFWDGQVPGKTPDPDDLSDVYDSFFPPWFPGKVTFHGGPGLTSPHRASETTVALDPGTYVVECYVKDPANDFHSYLGMIDQLDVTGADAGAPEPDATLGVSLSTAGIDAPDRVRPGRHAVGVTVEDQQVYGNLVGHDLHLVRLDGGTTAEAVNDWMNWADPAQFVSDGTEPGPFLGGVSDLFTADLPRTGYHHVALRPGDYAWVAEVPDPAGKGLLHEFTVPRGRATGQGRGRAGR